MVRKTLHPDVSYRQHLKELNFLLQHFGIASSHQLITANANRKQNRTGTNPELETVVGQVVAYIEEHLNEPLSLNLLAEEVSLSKYKLIRSFRDEISTTPWKYLISKRIERAKKLLQNGTPPGQVAVETGFYDQPHLHKTFREETDQTPKEYQEEHFKNRNQIL